MGISVWLVFENHNDPARITQMMKTVSPFKLVSSRSLCLLLGKMNCNQLEFLRFLGPQMLQAILACHIIRGRIPFEAPCHCFTWEKVGELTSSIYHSGIWAVGSNVVFNWMKGTCAGFTSKFHRKKHMDVSKRSLKFIHVFVEFVGKKTWDIQIKIFPP